MTASSEASLASSPRAHARIPDFFIVGHHKCGTTALYEMLRAHPQIFMPEIKEPWFFARDLRLRFEAANPLPETLDEYLSLFAGASAEQRAGEATPSYLMSQSAAGEIAELQPDARIIAVLREPAAFLRSLHLQSVRNHAETEPDLRKALALEPRRRKGEAIPPHAIRPQELLYFDHVRYVEQLRRYRSVFAPEQILVLIYEDFRRDNAATVRQVLRFLGVDDTVALQEQEANPTVRVRSPRTYEFVRSLYLGRGPGLAAAKAAIKAVTPASARRAALDGLRRRVLFAQPRPADEDLMIELRSQLKGEVAALSEYLDRDLVTLWGYDGIA
jgi:hypothetical protein